MISELMLVLTIIGAGIILIVWNNTRKRKRAEQARQEVIESTNEFKLELEKTADEIIERMEAKAAHLENLLDDSERNRAQLEGRVIELKKLLKRTENQSTEIRDLLERLDDAEEDVSTMQKQMDMVEKKINAAINVQIPQQPVLNNVPQIVPPLINPLMQTQPAVNQVQSPITPPPILRTPPPVQTVQKISEEKPAEEFAKVLEKSMHEEEISAKSAKSGVPPDRNSIVLSREIKRPATAVEAEPVKIESTRKVSANISETIAERQARVLAERQNRNANKITQKKSEEIRKAAVAAINNALENENTIELPPVEVVPKKEIPKPVDSLQKLKKRVEKNSESVRSDNSQDSSNIRNMLLSGMSVEEVARETGLGRGAIELVQQMTRRQLERK